MTGCYLEMGCGNDTDTCERFRFDYQLKIIQSLGIKIKYNKSWYLITYKGN